MARSHERRTLRARLARGDLDKARRKLEPALQLIDATLLPGAVELVEAHAYRDELGRLSGQPPR